MEDDVQLVRTSTDILVLAITVLLFAVSLVVNGLVIAVILASEKVGTVEGTAFLLQTMVYGHCRTTPLFDTSKNH